MYFHKILTPEKRFLKAVMLHVAITLSRAKNKNDFDVFLMNIEILRYNNIKPEPTDNQIDWSSRALSHILIPTPKEVMPTIESFVC